MSTEITGTVTLTPIAAVDTSSATSGVGMFTLNFPAEALDGNNLIQFEYWIALESSPSIKITNGFLPLEDSVTTSGIQNQVTIAVPSADNIYNPAEAQIVQIRVYVGATGTNEILVTKWSNACPLYNPPPQPENPIAYLIRGEQSGYLYEDLLYVMINNNTNYKSGQIDFVVSYNYIDQTGFPKWVVSQPLSNWTTSSVLNKIVLPELTLPIDVDVATGQPIYVAVNAIYSYEFGIGIEDTKNYYTVSQISDTVIATEGGFESPVLSQIDIPSDYYIYNSVTTRSQTVHLEWVPPSSSLIPNFNIVSYTIDLIVGGVVVDSETDISDLVTTYNYIIPAQYIEGSSTTTELTFQVRALFTSGGSTDSNLESVNTYTYATEPQNLIVNWAILESSTSNYDLYVSWSNPQNNGFGSVVDFTVEVYNNTSDLKYTQQVSYLAGGQPYNLYLNSILTSPTGTVKVFMNTKDTNSLTVYAGASSTANYVSTDLPIVENIARGLDDTSLSFDVLTNTGLDRVGTFARFVETFQFRQFLNVPGVYTSGSPVAPILYTVTAASSPGAEVMKYSYIFYPAYFLEDSIPYYLSVNISNSAGITSESMDI